MIDLKIIKAQLQLNTVVKELKLWLSQKETVTYKNHKTNNPTDKSAMDKIVSSYKADDEVWLSKEEELIQCELALKNITMLYNILMESLKCVQNPESGFVMEDFVDIQEEYIEALGEGI